MDAEVQRLVLRLVFQVSLFCTLDTISRDEGAIVVLEWQALCGLMLMMQAQKQMRVRRPRRLWAHDRGLNRPGIFDQNLLGYFNTREFKA
jgi:hypothetical protein